MAGLVLITTDLDRTLIFSPRATSQLGGGLPADAVESASHQTAGELSRAARAALAALPGHVRMCLATSRSLARLTRLRLPFPVHYAIAANGGIVLADGARDPEWADRIGPELASIAPAAAVRTELARFAGLAWLERMGDDDDMCVVAVVDRAALPAEDFAAISDSCLSLGWRASLIASKLYVFPAGFGKERAAAFVAERVAALAGQVPLRLAAGDTEHDRAMLAAADFAWAPAGSDLARCPADGIRVTLLPGHAGAAQITREWLGISGG